MSLGYFEPSTVVRLRPAGRARARRRRGRLVRQRRQLGRGRRAPARRPTRSPRTTRACSAWPRCRRSGSPAGFSSDNLSVQVAAPGVNVPAQGRDGQYWLVSGTSPACALTAGVAALIKARYPRLASALVVQAITSSTQNRPSGGYDNKVGFGTVDAAAALTVAGKLAGQPRSQAGAATTLHFGGGAAAVPPCPIAPRGAAGLVVACLFAARLPGRDRPGREAAGGPAARPVPGAPRGGPDAAAGLARPPGPRHLAGPGGSRASRGAGRRVGGPGLRLAVLARPQLVSPRARSAAGLRQPGARRRGLDPARPGHVLRRRGRVPGAGRPPPGRPGHGPVGRQRAVVAGGARRRVPGARARAGRARAVPRRGHPAAPVPGRAAVPGGHAPGPLGGRGNVAGPVARPGIWRPAGERPADHSARRRTNPPDTR